MANSRGLLERLLKTPDLPTIVPRLEPEVLHRVIEACGLEDSRVEVSEEERPQVLEVLCDECETALNFDEMDETIQKELRLTLGAR